MMKKAGRVLSIAACVMIAASFAACKGGGAKAGLKIDKTNFLPGEGITVAYTALPEYDSSAWVGIIPSAVPHGSESENDSHDISYQYLQKSTAGTLTFAAPNQPGTYDFRMHNTDSNGVEVATVTFTVAGTVPQQAPVAVAPEATTAPAQAVPIAGAKKFKVGDSCMVEWKGSWWPAKVISTRDGNSPYKIHYDGYSNSWDEWVGDARIKNLARSK